MQSDHHKTYNQKYSINYVICFRDNTNSKSWISILSKIQQVSSRHKIITEHSKHFYIFSFTSQFHQHHQQSSWTSWFISSLSIILSPLWYFTTFSTAINEHVMQLTITSSSRKSSQILNSHIRTELSKSNCYNKP